MTQKYYKALLLTNIDRENFFKRHEIEARDFAEAALIANELQLRYGAEIISIELILGKTGPAPGKA